MRKTYELFIRTSITVRNKRGATARKLTQVKVDTGLAYTDICCIESE